MPNRDGIEEEAERIYRAARLDPEAGATPAELIRALLGPRALRFVTEEWLRGGGTLARVGNEWRVYLRWGMRPERARFVALHELSHYVLGSDASEDDCDALAACLLAPRPAFQRALAVALEHRRSPARVYGDLGAWFRCTDSFAAMRLAEVTGAPLALVSPLRARVRGAPYPWPPELQQLALAPRAPGLRKARLRDDPRRVVLAAG